MFTFIAASCITLSLSLATDTTRAKPSADSATTRTQSWRLGAAYLRFGTTQLGLSAINDVLTRNGRPSFAEGAPMIGFSAHARMGRLLLGATGETSISPRRSDNAWMTQLSAGIATLDAGVAVYERGATMIATTASLGIRRTGLRFESRGDFSYDDGVSNPARGVMLSSRSGVAQTGLLVEQRMRAPRIGALSLSAQLGISVPFGGASTFAGESRVVGSPAPASGTYVRVAVGKPLGKRGEALNAVWAALISMVPR